ncbi:alpha/beta hydrolase [Vallitalea pronyensis]|uniref:Alpha/beta hydrolase n=1 Tax=Vallitalea pronyensis TaxID=1348613 RepID=A0A8J8MJS2_9FIRM|nr:alpha/beta hydrolase [Vallitalea pronyensis]QUI22791.1 alpha/beta hydrolase [Vallitalea pronyensis]
MINVFKSDKKREEVLASYDHLLGLWGVDYDEVDLVTQFGTTHCILSGDKTNPPLLMFHGVGDNSAVMWILNIGELSKYFYCISVDTLGGPGKSIPNEQFTKATFNQVEWINEVVSQLQISHFNILGISNGAYMAYNYLTYESKKVNRVVCLEGGMLIGNPIKNMLKTIFIMFPQILLPNRKNMIAILKKLSSPESNFINNCPEVVDHMIMVMKRHNQKAMFVHTIEKYHKEKGMAVRDKLYFLMGHYKLDRKREFVKALDDGQFKYKVIKGAGHGINHEQPERVNAEIIQYLLGD